MNPNLSKREVSFPYRQVKSMSEQQQLLLLLLKLLFNNQLKEEFNLLGYWSVNVLTRYTVYEQIL